MTKQDFEKLKQIFFTKLEQKTGWGKEEVKKLFMEAVIEFVIERKEEK